MLHYQREVVVVQHFSGKPQELVASFWRNRYLIKASVGREVVGRYRGSFLGILWSFFNPMFMLAVYTFVFSVVFKARWNGGSDSKTEFALILFAGLMVFNLFAECINRAPGLILAHSNYVKKVVFPLEILVWVNLGGALFHACISLLVWLLAYIILFGTPHFSIVFLPIVIFPLLFFIVGLSWWLASLGVYLRDISQFIGIVTTAMLFLSPIFYSASSLPENYQIVLQLNPLTNVIAQVRGLLLWGEMPDLSILCIQYVVAICIACIGFTWFQKTRKGFADVI